MRKIIFGSLIAFIVVASALLIERSYRLSKGIHPNESGESLPEDVRLKDLSTGKNVILSQFKGKVLLINFWASWCGPCLVEMPGILKLREKLSNQGFEVLLINMDEDPEKTVPNIVKKLNINLPIYIDEGHTFEGLYDISGIPFSILVDRHMHVLWADAGERDWTSDSAISDIELILKSSAE